MNHNTLYIGIDPGKQGYITIMYKEGEPEFKKIPLIGKEYDVTELSKIFSVLNSLSETTSFTHCVVEDVHAIFGASAGSTFEFGYGVGLIEMGLVMAHIPFTKVAPKKWQKEMFEGIPEQRKPSSSGKTMKVDTKLMALQAAKRLFPNVDLRDTEKCKKPHDGKIDSLLICEYCSRNF